MIPMDQYEGARAEAEHTAELLRAALQRVGVPERDTARVRFLVTTSGRAYVALGTLPVGSAVKLLDALPYEVQQ
ncbi:hypothetical protein CA983_13440 [Streptomyces swartbergensis]|uniref:Uncharacterized protein n=1 Tax=Streptomyces swartbergensis TaxID=487165 RepID=A0A243S540_9ACTN|nr:hypothetical protein CA983_13440 [Streptomyces swartbergensis]